jgi:hypothetical protein
MRHAHAQTKAERGVDAIRYATLRRQRYATRDSGGIVVTFKTIFNHFATLKNS